MTELIQGNREVNIMTLSRSSNIFGDDIYKQLSKRSGNIIFSPLSVFSTLSLLALGCADRTQLEILNNIHTSSTSQLKKNFNSLNKYLSTLNSSLYMSNYLFASYKYPVLRRFEAASRTYFEVTPQLINFSNKGTADVINNWLSNQTSEAITNIIDNSTLSLSTSVLLLNSINFKGIWEQTFDSTSQIVGNYSFLTSKGNDLCNMMISENYPQMYYSEDDFLVLSLSIQESHIKIAFVVTRLYGKKKINEIEKRFDSKKLFEIIPKLRTGSFPVEIPKFKLAYEFDLKEMVYSVKLVLSYGVVSFNLFLLLGWN